MGRRKSGTIDHEGERANRGEKSYDYNCVREQKLTLPRTVSFEKVKEMRLFVAILRMRGAWTLCPFGLHLQSK